MAQDRILWDVLEEHLDEAAFLFTQWEAGLQSPRLTPLRLATTTEERLLSHLDALAVAGPDCAEWLSGKLSSTTSGVVFAAAVTLLSPELEGCAAPVFVRLARAEASARHELGQALRHTLTPSTQVLLNGLVQEGPGVVRAVALELLAEEGALGRDAVTAALRSSAPPLNVAGLRAARRLALPGLAPEITALLTAEHAGVRREALITGMVLGLEAAQDACLTGAEWYASPEALELLARAGHPEAFDLLRDALDVPELASRALKSLGMSGLPAGAAACLTAMNTPELNPLAAEAFALITGAPYEQLGALSAQEEISGAEDPADWERLPVFKKLQPEDELPRVDPEPVLAWWAAHRGDFPADRRIVHGRLADAQGFEQALEEASLYRRPLLARMLESFSQGRCQLRTRALCRLQRLEVRPVLKRWSGPTAGGL